LKTDPSNFVPLYVRIINHITEKIERGEYKEGQKIPSEAALAREFGVSRITVTNAIQRMVQEGTLYRQQGRGTFVAKRKPVEHRLTSLISFTEDMFSRGYRISTRLIGFERANAPEKVRQALELPEGARVWKIKRVRYADDEPMAIQTAYLPETMFPNLDSTVLGNNSLYKLLKETYRLQMSEAVEHYRVIILRREEDAALLNVSTEVPALHCIRISSCEDGGKFEYTESILRGDRYVLSVRLTATPH
jgi:GntR family transcriptional regulator